MALLQFSSSDDNFYIQLPTFHFKPLSPPSNQVHVFVFAFGFGGIFLQLAKDLLEETFEEAIISQAECVHGIGLLQKEVADFNVRLGPREICPGSRLKHDQI